MTCDCRDTRLAIIRLKSRSITAPRAEIIQNRCSLILRLIASWSRSARIALRKAYAQQAPRQVKSARQPGTLEVACPHLKRSGRGQKRCSASEANRGFHAAAGSDALAELTAPAEGGASTEQGQRAWHGNVEVADGGGCPAKTRISAVLPEANHISGEHRERC